MIKITADLTRSLQVIASAETNISDLRPAWASVHHYMQNVILMQFDGMSGDIGDGKTLRGVRWKYFKDQYTRKSDNVTVPAWCGVERFVFSGGYVSLGKWIGKNRPNYRRTAKARKKEGGKVLGRLRTNRASNIRVKKGDSVNVQSGKMRSGILQKVRMTEYQIVMHSAGNQKKIFHLNNLRPFQFFEIPKDIDEIKNIITKHLEKGIE